MAAAITASPSWRSRPAQACDCALPDHAGPGQGVLSAIAAGWERVHLCDTWTFIAAACLGGWTARLFPGK